MSTRLNKHNCLSALLVTAISLNIAPAAWGQAFTPPKPTNLVPIATPTITPQIITTPQAQQPQTPVETPRTEVRPNLPTFNVPTFQSTVILPTDTLPFRAGNDSAQKGSGPNDGSERVAVTQVDDLGKFLASFGWNGEVLNDNANGTPKELDETDAVTVDTALGETLPEGFIPIAYTPDTGAKQVIIRVNKACPELLVFTAFNQFEHASSGAASDALLYGEPGTVISNNEKAVTIHTGQLVADAGENVVRIATAGGGIKIPKHSTAIVDYKPSNRLSVKALATEGKEAIKVRLAALPDKIFELRSGQELSVDLSKQDNALLESVATQDIELINYVNTLPSHVTGDAAPHLARLRKHLLTAAGLKGTETAAHSNKSMHTARPVRVLALEGTRFIASNSGRVGMLEGSLLVRTDSPQIFRAKYGDVYMQPGTIAAVQRWQGELRVNCCSDPHSTILVSDKMGIPLSWGTEALIVDHPATWNDAIPNDGVGRRRFEMHKVQDKSCIISDFSIASLILKSSHLQPLRKPVDREKRELRDQMLKTAAALQVVTGAKGGYYVQPPQQQATQTNTQ